jgi:predicted RNase H-like nuclease (RuvC/YqgF family)
MAANLLAEWLNPTTLGAACAATGAAIAKLVDWAITRRKAHTDVSTEMAKLAQVSQEAAFRNLIALVEKLREDVAELRDELEESERRRTVAEDTIRKLRDEVHSLRNELHRRGFAAPAEPK